MKKNNRKNKGKGKNEKKDAVQIADFLFEVGTMRKLMRIHRQLLLTDDMSDSIASHSFRVARNHPIMATRKELSVIFFI